MRILLVPPKPIRHSVGLTDTLAARLGALGHMAEILELPQQDGLRSLLTTLLVLRAARVSELVVVEDNPAAAFAAWLARCIFGRRYVLLLSSARPSRLAAWPPFSLAYRSLYRRAGHALLLTTAARNALLKSGVPRNCVELTAPPAGIAAAHATPSAAKQDIPRQLVATLVPQSPRTIAALLRILANVLETEAGVELWVYCPRGSAEDLADRVAALGLEAHVHIEETRWNPASSQRGIALIHSAPGDTPDARFALDAFAAGLPVAATRHDLINDWLKDGETALLVPVGDETALSGDLVRLLRDPALAQRLAMNARARAQSHHGWDAFLAALLDE